ncbi:hypothetical protein [Planctomyces sp. SH-PL14]|uniref:glycoside hydrolase family 38 N-terminal domain-containing protein n=1 Tax=Planctomyces sp. SH-PL14 TaxID=1632864 RepID=UPI0009462D80|nr:hypothetical protein [Planctomyces sp. SH-PL14]
MTYDDLLILIPSHSLEDFPTELGEKQAEGLLNPFIVAWHPVLIANAQRLPRWQRADENIPVQPNRLVMIPTKCAESVPESWIERARREGMHVVTGITERQALIDAVLAPLDQKPAVDPDLTADFLAFGHLYIQSELLTRHMRNFSHLDEPHLEREIVAAAKAACTQDGEGARKHLRHCYEMLLECRERYYPVDCFLLDLCLVIPRLAGEKLQQLLRSETPLNLMVTGADLEEIATTYPETIRLLKEGIQAKRVELIGGEHRDLCTPLLDLDTTVRQLTAGREVYERLLGTSPVVWGRRRYGVSRQMPQVLGRSGFTSGLHFVMDDGIYPDEEQSKLRWEGCDNSTLDSFSRIPLAGDSASSYLRLPVRVSESMDHDHVAGVCIARWPELRTPWLEDLRRAERYAPILGKFTTFGEFFTRTEHSGRPTEFKAEGYLSPFFVQAVAKQEAAPGTRYVEWWNRQTAFQSAAWLRTMAAMLWGRDWPALVAPTEAAFSAADPEAALEVVDASRKATGSLLSEGKSAMTAVFQHGTTSGRPGWIAFNPLSFARKAVISTDSGEAAVDGTRVLAAQAEGKGSTAVVEIPPCGFIWIPAAPAGTSQPSPSAKGGKAPPPLAEGLTVRNELFEVVLSDVTGGISQVRTYHRSPNRVSQQLAFRFSRERTINVGEGDEAQSYKTYYSEMQMTGSRVLATGPAVGAIETTGVLIDQQTGQTLAGYRQEVRLARGRSTIDVTVELDVQKKAEGDPWSNYYCARFAWKDSTAALTRAVQMGAHPVGEQERIESPHYVEIADESWRTTILGRGLTFHRQTGDRMVDTIFVTEGETARTFHFSIAIDDQYPMQAALDAMTPPIVLPVEKGPPSVGETGWLVHIGTRNVVLTGLHPIRGEGGEALATGSGFALRLLETEGRSKVFKLRLFRAPTSARQRDFRGHTVQTLQVDGDAVVVHIAPHEICEVEVTF